MTIAWLSVHELAAMAAPQPDRSDWARVLAADLRDRRMAALADLPPLPHDEIDRNRMATGDRAFFAARRSVLRNVIGRIAACAGADVDIRYDADGAPRVMRPQGYFVSIAGQGSYALLAIAGTGVGVDFEPLQQDVSPVADVLHPAEKLRLAAMPGEEARAEFLFIWTAKEAYLKARGRGFLEDPGHFETRFDDGRISILRDGMAEAATGRLHVVGLDGALFAAACVELCAA